jgi:hypothetical protein
MGFQVIGVGFQVLGSRCWVPGVGFQVLGSRCWVPGVGFQVLGSKCWVQGVGLIAVFGFRVKGYGFRDLRSGVRSKLSELAV